MSIRRYIDPSRLAEILSLIRSYVEKNMVIEPGELYLDGALEISLNHGITVYDSLCIAQVIRHGGPLLTLNQRQEEVENNLGIRCIP